MAVVTDSFHPGEGRVVTSKNTTVANVCYVTPTIQHPSVLNYADPDSTINTKICEAHCKNQN